MKTILFIILIFSCAVSLSQSAGFPYKFFESFKQELNNAEQNIEVNLAADTTGSDLMYLVGSKNPVKGRLIEVGTKTITFIDNSGVNYNLSKKEVRFIRTSDGRTLNYNVDEDEEYTATEKVEKDSGGIGGWGVVGIVLTILLVLGIVSALAR